MLKRIYNRYKNSLLFASAIFIVQGINAITLPIFTRILTQADYGILSASNSVQNFSTAIFRLGIQQSVLKQYLGYSENEKRAYLFSVILFSLIWALLLFAIFMLINFFWGINLFENVAFNPYISVAILTSAFSTAYAIFQSYLRLLNIAKKFIVITIIYFVLNISLSFIFITQFNLGALGKLLGGLIPYFAIFIYISIKTFSTFKIKYWVDAIRFGYPLAISAIIFSIIMMYTISYLTRRISLDELGLYQIGRNLGLLIPDFLFQSLLLTYQPFLYRRLRERKISEITKQNTIIIGGLVFAIIVAGLLAKWIILIFTTREYLSAITLMRLFLFSYVFKVIYFFPMISLFNKNKTILFTKIELFALCIFLLSIHLFVPCFSIEGVALAVIGQESIKLILVVYYSKLHLNQIFNLKTIIKP